MLPRKESSFLSSDLFSFPHSLKQNSFQRTTLIGFPRWYKPKSINEGRQHKHLYLTTDSHQRWVWGATSNQEQENTHSGFYMMQQNVKVSASYKGFILITSIREGSPITCTLQITNWYVMNSPSHQENKWLRRELSMVSWEPGYNQAIPLAQKIQLTLKTSTVHQKGSDKLFEYHKKGFYCAGYVDRNPFTRIWIDRLVHQERECCTSPATQRDQHPTAELAGTAFYQLIRLDCFL